MAKLAVPVSPQDHSMGDPNAAVTLVEYGDYQCPDCLRAFASLKRVHKHFGDRLHFIYRNFPLEQHEFAEPAAETAEFAGAHGKFWEMHDALYNNQHLFADDLFPELAEKLGLNAKALSKALLDGDFADRVDGDLEGGESSKVRGTPTFFINGEPFEGDYDAQSLIEAIEAAGA